MRCPYCYQDTLERRRGRYPEGKYVIKRGDWLECSNCGEHFFESKMMKKLEKAFYFNNKLLTPRQIKRNRLKYNKTKRQLADDMCVPESLIERWEGGGYILPSDKSNQMRRVFLKWKRKR